MKQDDVRGDLEEHDGLNLGPKPPGLADPVIEMCQPEQPPVPCGKFRRADAFPTAPLVDVYLIGFNGASTPRRTRLGGASSTPEPGTTRA
jgi:hypothetical protein